MIDNREVVIVKNYCGYLVSVEVTASSYETLYNITLMDRFDPRITITLEDIREDEIRQNPLP